MAQIHVSLDEVVGYFAELEEPRSSVNLKHPLVSVVVIAMMAVLAGAGGPTAIAKWAALKEEFFHQQLAGGREAICPSYPQSLVHRKQLPLESRYDLP